MTSRVLVVGASGPLGPEVVRELRQFGHEVTGASRSGALNTEKLDVADLDAASNTLHRLRPNAVVYLVRPDLPDSTNSHGPIEASTVSLRAFAEMCADVGVRRFIFASSAAVYGDQANHPVGEEIQPTPKSPYADLKLRSERVLEIFDSEENFAVCSLRVFNIYGPRFSNSLINRLTLRLKPAIYDTESFVRDYIHVSDVARGFRLAVEDRSPIPGILNLGTGQGTSNRSLIALYPDAPFERLPASGIYSYSVADVTRIRDHLGFEAATLLA